MCIDISTSNTREEVSGHVLQLGHVLLMAAHLLFRGLGLGSCGNRGRRGGPISGSRRRTGDVPNPAHGQIGLNLLGQLGVALGLLGCLLVGLLLLLLLLFGHAALRGIDILETIIVSRQFGNTKLGSDRRGLLVDPKLVRAGTRGWLAQEELSGARRGRATGRASRAVQFQPTTRGWRHGELTRPGVAGGQLGRRTEDPGGPTTPRRLDGPLGLVGLLLLHGIVEVVEKAAGRCSGIGSVVPFHELAALPCLGIDQLLQLDPVGLGGLGIVLLIRLLVHVLDAMLAKEGPGIAIAADPHGIDLPLRPLVEVDAPYEGEVHPHRAVGGTAIQAQEHPMRHRGPRRTGVGTVEADLVVPDGLQFAKLRILVRGGDAHLALAGGGDHTVLADVAGLAGIGRVGGGARSGGRHCWGSQQWGWVIL